MPEARKINPRVAGVVMFFAIWCLYGLTTNLWDQYGYNLMHAGVESLAERGRFYLEGSRTPKFREIEKPRDFSGRDASTDVFWRNGHLYPMKHPGMFFLGALVYKPLSVFGLTYDKEYNLATAAVSWLTAGLAAALAVALLFHQALREDLSGHASMTAAFCLGIGSIFFAYAGTLHHDILAACFLYFAYYAALGPSGKNERRFTRNFSAGALAGFAFTCSPLAAFFLLPFALAILFQKSGYALLNFAAGCALGVLPLLIYNGAAFGNPFLLPNMAGEVADTGFAFSLKRFGENFHWYFLNPRRAFWAFMPAYVFAGAGLIMRAARKNRDAWLLIGGPCLLLFYVMGIQTRGGAAFGPRYLLPALPLVAVGLIPILNWKKRDASGERSWPKTAAAIVVGLAFAAGVTVCFSGAVRGSMYGMPGHPFARRLSLSLGLSGARGTPGPNPLLYPVIFFAACAYYFLMGRFFSPVRPDEETREKKNGS